LILLEVRSASRPRLLAVAFGHRALLWPLFEKGIFFSRRKTTFSAEDDIFGGRRHFRRIFSTFPGRFSKFYFFLFSLFRSDLSIMENFFSPDGRTDEHTNTRTESAILR
jgi:hypothetical protein